MAEHINDAIEEQVRAQVEDQLTYHIPQTLQAQVFDQKRQLDEVKRALFNSWVTRSLGTLITFHMVLYGAERAGEEMPYCVRTTSTSLYALSTCPMGRSPHYSLKTSPPCLQSTVSDSIPLN